MKKEVNVCDVCKKEIAVKKCEVCEKDLCSDCFQSIDYGEDTILVVCDRCVNLSLDTDEEFKKFLIERLKRVAITENLNEIKKEDNFSKTINTKNNPYNVVNPYVTTIIKDNKNFKKYQYLNKQGGK